MAGVLACGSYCAVWAAVNGIAGLACAVVCGAASEGACAMNH
ncbi:putative immunity/bacteriocin fusion bifunctional protein [Secundilactobacillus oryzae]